MLPSMHHRTTFTNEKTRRNQDNSEKTQFPNINQDYISIMNNDEGTNDTLRIFIQHTLHFETTYTIYHVNTVNQLTDASFKKNVSNGLYCL
jgi:hypothetical protein